MKTILNRIIETEVFRYDATPGMLTDYPYVGT